MNFKKYLLDYQFDVYKKFQNIKIHMVLGYQAKKIQSHLKDKKIKTFVNQDFKKTNMYYSFLKAKSLLNQKRDLVVVYGDIIFKKKFLIN